MTGTQYPHLWVQKFGGTSLGSSERILSIAKKIQAVKQNETPLIVVVSAMGKTTDDLIALARQVSMDPNGREMDMLLTAGERISMALLSMALFDLNIPAVSFTGSQVGLITDRHHRRARIKRILGDRVRAALDAGKVVIVAGFQGISEDKDVTTLGRGGSDTTAVALAAHFQAERCEIYTDVDGVYSTDPRAVSTAKLFHRLDSATMIEMAYAGAGVLHPRCVELARQFRVPLWLKSSFNETPGTEIVHELEKGKPMEKFHIQSVVSDEDQVRLDVEFSRSSVITSLLETASDLSFFAPRFFEASFSCFIQKDQDGEWRKILDRLVLQGFVKQWVIDENQVPLSVIGDHLIQNGIALSQVLDCLAKQHISVTMGGVTALSMTFSVPKHRAEDAVRALHDEFI